MLLQRVLGRKHLQVSSPWRGCVSRFVTRAVLMSHQWLSCCRLRVHKYLAGDSGRTHDLNWPKRCSIHCSTGLRITAQRSSPCSETGWAPVCWWELVRDWLHLHPLILVLLFFFTYEIVFISTYEFLSLLPCDSLCLSAMGGMNNNFGLDGCLAVSWGQPITIWSLMMMLGLYQSWGSGNGFSGKP